jgi:hypothetical protein
MFNTMGMHAGLPGMSFAPFIFTHADITDIHTPEDTHHLPLNSGGGKACKDGLNTLNAFIEPPWTTHHKGDDLSQFILLTVLNVTFEK